LVGWFYTTTKLPPLLYRVAPFSTAAATTDFHLSEGIWLFSHWLRLLATFLTISLGSLFPPPSSFFPIPLGFIMPATPPTSPRGRARHQERIHRTLGSPEQRRTPTPSTSAMPPPPPRQLAIYNDNAYNLPSNLAIGVHNLLPMPAPLHRRLPPIPAPASVSLGFYFYI